MSQKLPTLGVSLYSFTNEWQQRQYNLEQMIGKVVELGLGPAVEVVGFQSFRGYPDVSDDTARQFRGLMDRYGLIPSCLGGNTDVGRRSDRLMTTDEILAYVQRQLVSAQKLGFPVLRIQAFVGPQVLEKIAPLAEQARIQVACELHSPLTVDNPEVVELVHCYERVGSEYIGFVPDFSCSMRSVPEGYWANLKQEGAPAELIAEMRKIWATNQPIPVKFGAIAEAAAVHGGDPAMQGKFNASMTMFGHMPVSDWTSLLKYARHIHGKFYEVNAEGMEPSIPYPEIIALLKKAGYAGTISAEWEGQAFSEEQIGFQQVQAWHAMCSRLLA